MKKIVLISFLTFVSFILKAQTHNYYFANNFNEANGQAPALTQLLTCSAASGNFNDQIITTSSGNCSNTPSPAFSFNKGAGFSYPNNNFINGTYTISFLFKFNTLSGYQRILDFKNSTTDAGIYTLSECLNFYPNGNAGTCPYFAVNTYYLFTIIRDGVANKVNVYINGNLFVSDFADAGAAYVPTTTTTPIIFFRDDNSAPCETGAGSIKYLSLKNTTSTPAQVLNNWNNICLQALPLTLISFAGKNTEKYIELNWKTENEINVAEINIERSSDGQTFDLLKNVSAKNNSVNNYLWVDSTVFYSDSKIFYYRLKMIDVGGIYKYSKVVKIENKHKKDIILYPNPVKNSINVTHVKLNDVLILQTISGKTLERRVVKNNLETINLQKYPTGIYIIKLQNNAGIKTSFIEKL